MKSADSPLRRLLVARGLTAGDADVLERQQASTAVLGISAGSPLETLGAHLDTREVALVASVVADALAAGPHGRFASPWRRLFVAGCPLDHLWRTLWHAFKDPAADYQDVAWLAEADGMANVERYVALGFPRLQMPSMFGPGLGCASLLENARGGVLELLRVRAPTIAVVDALCAGRAALSARARADVDARASIDAERVVARPSPEALSSIGAKLVRGDDLTDDERAAWSFFDLPEDREDHLILDDAPVEAIAVRWFEVVHAGLSTGRIVLDVAQDRYRLVDEPSASKPALAPRSALPGPLARPVDLDATLASWGPRDPMGGLPNADQLEQEDPILWLRAIAEALAASDSACEG